MLRNLLHRKPQPTWRNLARPSLLTPMQAQPFGGMMGMGELADTLAGKCDPNDAI